MNSFFDAWKKCFQFRGRSRRLEFWVFNLISLLVLVGFAVIDKQMNLRDESEGLGLLSYIYVLLSLVPQLSVLTRRLHDTDHSVGAYFFVLIPLAGIFIVMKWLIQPGDIGENRFGPDPKAVTKRLANDDYLS